MKLGKIFDIFIFGFFIIFIISFLAYRNPYLELSFFLILSIGYTFISLKRPDLALLIIIAELGISGFGYLLYADLGFFKLSLRMIFFVIFIISNINHIFWWLLNKIKNLFETKFELKLIKKNHTYYFLFFFIYFLIMAIIGSLKYSKIVVYQDFNGYLFYLLLIGIVSIRYLKIKRDYVIQLFSAIVVWQFFMAFFLEFMFSHTIIYQEVLPITYKWLRDLRIVEIGIFKGNFYRIFSQSFIWSVFIFFVLNNLKDNDFKFKISYLKSKKSIIKFKDSITNILLITFCLFTIIVSLSRSFWLSSFICFLFFSIDRFCKKKFKVTIFKNIFALIFSIFLILIIFWFPLAGKDSKLAFLALKERTTKTNEIAVRSRWSQLSPLLSEISKKPIFGYGFGKEITYKSFDPKVFGEYTTFAFEWGYLDILLKTGIVGIFIYLLFLISILITLFKKREYWLFYGLLALLIIHIFTPYLNHPLGIGYILLCEIALRNKLY